MVRFLIFYIAFAICYDRNNLLSLLKGPEKIFWSNPRRKVSISENLLTIPLEELQKKISWKISGKISEKNAKENPRRSSWVEECTDKFLKCKSNKSFRKQFSEFLKKSIELFRDQYRGQPMVNFLLKSLRNYLGNYWWILRWDLRRNR